MSSHSDIESVESKLLVPRVNPDLIARSPEVLVPTPQGNFLMTAWGFADHSEHLSLRAADSHGQPIGTEHSDQVPAVRLHSECATGDIFGSFRCDCGPQLEKGLTMIQEVGGFLLYLRQHEGRGIGLVNKLRAYQLQQEGLDTVDANEAQGLDADARDYRQATIILQELGLASLRLISNNPAKAHALKQAGIEITEILSNEIQPRPENQTYLETKRARMNHLLTPLQINPINPTTTQEKP